MFYGNILTVNVSVFKTKFLSQHYNNLDLKDGGHAGMHLCVLSTYFCQVLLTCTSFDLSSVPTGIVNL